MESALDAVESTAVGHQIPTQRLASIMTDLYQHDAAILNPVAKNLMRQVAKEIEVICKCNE